MLIPQHQLSLYRFGYDMRNSDPEFANWVIGFEARFGVVDDEMLAVLAQATYFCWFEQEYMRDLAEVCKAIGAGCPTSLYLCNLVTPSRWVALHAYVVGVQRWLGIDTSIPASMAHTKISQIETWLGEKTPIKEGLANLYLRWLCEGLSHYPLSILNGIKIDADEIYEDFSDWYPSECRSCVFSASESTDMGVYYGKTYDDDIALIQQDIRHMISPAGDAAIDIEELMQRLVCESQPGCMHRFTRYQDIKVTIIGALKWRGAVPTENDTPKRAAVDYLDIAIETIKSWCLGNIDSNAPIHTLLGDFSEQKAYILNNFLLKPKDGLTSAFYHWILKNRILNMGCEELLMEIDHPFPRDVVIRFVAAHCCMSARLMAAAMSDGKSRMIYLIN